jgi:hypothetical protein
MDEITYLNQISHSYGPKFVRMQQKIDILHGVPHCINIYTV